MCPIFDGSLLIYLLNLKMTCYSKYLEEIQHPGIEKRIEDELKKIEKKISKQNREIKVQIEKGNKSPKIWNKQM